MDGITFQGAILYWHFVYKCVTYPGVETHRPFNLPSPPVYKKNTPPQLGGGDSQKM